MKSGDIYYKITDGEKYHYQIVAVGVMAVEEPWMERQWHYSVTYIELRNKLVRTEPRDTFQMQFKKIKTVK